MGNNHVMQTNENENFCKNNEWCSMQDDVTFFHSSKEIKRNKTTLTKWLGFQTTTK